MSKEIQISKKVLVITDPQRRVYNGCPYSSEYQYKPFKTLETLPNDISEEDAEKRLNFWIDLNNYAVSERGEGSRNKYRILEDIDVN